MERNLKTRVDSDIKDAMKSGDTLTRDTLRVLKSEVERGQYTKDVDVSGEAKKMIDNLKVVKSDTSEKEIEILQKYMPPQLTDEGLSQMVEILIKTNGYSSMKDMGTIMGYFSKSYPNQYDGSVLSKLVKEKLSK